MEVIMTKTELKTTIERIVEKKVKLEVKKQLSEILIKESAHSPKIAKPKVKKQVVQQKEMKHYTSNESLNKILNETANGDWKTLGGEGKVFDTNNRLGLNFLKSDIFRPNFWSFINQFFCMITFWIRCNFTCAVLLLYRTAFDND